MPAFVVVEIEIHDPAAYERYKLLAPPSIGLYGGCYLTRGGSVEALEGEWKPKRTVLLQFPSVERARAWHASPEYAPARVLRQSIATSTMLLLDGLAVPFLPGQNTPPP